MWTPEISSTESRAAPSAVYGALPCRPPPHPLQCGCSHRSEEHTSELQSHSDLVCRLLLEKKKRPHHTAVTRNNPTHLARRTNHGNRHHLAPSVSTLPTDAIRRHTREHADGGHSYIYPHTY